MNDWKEKIKKKNPEFVSRDHLEDTAVILPIYNDEDGKGVLLTSRREDLPRHAGQISFPGGRQEEQDNDLISTGLRELHEEVGVPPNEVEVIGPLAGVETTTGYSIKPFVGEIPYPYDFIPQESEVKEIIHADIETLTDPNIHEVKTKSGYRIHYFYYDEYTIWGATAEILARFLKLTENWSPRKE